MISFTAPDLPGFDYYQQWPCQNQPWQPPMTYDPCQSGNAGQEPVEYWDGLIFPDCCVVQCAMECYPTVITEQPPRPISTCPYHVPGWNVIRGYPIYLGSYESALSWFAAEAKAIEVGGRLLEFDTDHQHLDGILDDVQPCK